MLRNYYSSQSPQALAAQSDTLIVFTYDKTCAPAEGAIVPTGMAGASGDSISEVWSLSGESIEHFREGRFYCHRGDSLLCSVTWLTEEECLAIEDSAEQVYLALFECLKQQGYTTPVRIWNYLPHINQGEGDQEFYKRFCSGRLHAFNQLGLNEQSYPAASALGHRQKGAMIAAFATRQGVVNHQNTRQVDAFKYPRQYGASSPSFARAATAEVNTQKVFFISGTASILGHQTTELDDFSGQLATTIDNIRHLLNKASEAHIPLVSLKAYVRQSHHAPSVRQVLAAEFPEADILVVEADICRDNLLVEVEGYCA